MAKSWTSQQLDAMNTKDRDILVSAAAGSGKTAVLVERIVNKITKENGTDIDRLVVVTFTKAAAAEMKARVRNRLDDMLDEDEKNSNLIKQIALINNAQITTIDSFCLWILKNHFSEINLDPGFRVADKGEITLLENDVMQDMLEDNYKESDEQFLALIDAYGTGRSDANIEEIIKKIYVLARSNPWPDEWYEQVIDTYTGMDNSNNKVLVNLYESIQCSARDYKRKYEYMIELCGRVDGPISYLDAINSDYMNICRIIDAADFDELSERVIKTEFTRLSTKRMPDARDDLKEYVKVQRDKYKKYIAGLLKTVFTADIDSLMEDVHSNAPAISMMVKLSKDFADRMEEEKRDRGIVEFSDIEHYALDILVTKQDGSKEYTNVADELAEYFNEILVDEYQDSNQLQEEILTAVSRHRLSDVPDNMYMVGDVKQSIYKFRLACPELFMNKYYSYSGYDEQKETGVISDCKIELQKNFRSRKNVLDTTNDVFYRVMNRNYCGIEYDSNQQLNCGFEYPECTDKRNFGWEDEKSTETVLIDTSEDDENSSIEAEAMYMAERIKKFMSKDEPYYVFDTDLSDYRRIQYKDIVILTRTLSGWADTIVNILLDRDIPAMADTSQQYFKLREIKVLISLLTCIDNPLQDIPMAAVLLSYFGGFTEDELADLRVYGKKSAGADRLFVKQMQSLINDAEIKDTDKKENAEKLSALSDKCEAFLDKLKVWREKSRLMTIYDLLWDIVYNTGYYDYVGTMPAGKKRQSNIDVLLDKASSFEGTSYSGLFNFLRYIERLQKYDIELTDSSGTGGNGDSVRIMSIHKSKGLEFPVVIMAGLNKQINKTDARNKLVIDRELGIGTDYVNLTRQTKTPTLIKGAIARKILRDSISEEERVLYVAMTRAREKLIMVGGVTSIDKKMSAWQMISDELCVNGVYSYADCENIDRYSDMIMPVALMKQEDNKGTFEFSLISSADIIKEDEAINKEAQSENESADEDTGINKGKESMNESLNDTDVYNDDKAQTYDRQKTEGLPPYIKDPDADRKVKVTVTELKQMQADADYDSDAFMQDDIKAAYDEAEHDEDKSRAAGTENVEEGADSFIPTIPKFISGSEETLRANERGTAYHRVMECLDYNNVESFEDVQADIHRMLETERMSEVQINNINVKDIYTFVSSPIGKRVRAAAISGNMRREQPFVFEYDRQLVQGVIDLFIIEDGKIVIVDYKTDRVRKGEAGEKELIKRYSVQLDYYAKALSQLTGLEVKEKLIYSFTLGREINVGS